MDALHFLSLENREADSGKGHSAGENCSLLLSSSVGSFIAFRHAVNKHQSLSSVTLTCKLLSSPQSLTKVITFL